jgi:hypothetical protein
MAARSGSLTASCDVERSSRRLMRRLLTQCLYWLPCGAGFGLGEYLLDQVEVRVVGSRKGSRAPEKDLGRES